jgi:hypothetical protein
MVMHLPMLRTIIPTCVIYIFSIIIPIARWDFFEDAIVDPNDFKSEDAQEVGIFSQARLLGYTSDQVLYNIRFISFFIVFYFARIIFCAGLKIYRTPVGNQRKLQKMYTSLKRSLFFEEFFYLIIEPFICYVIAGSIQFDTYERKAPGVPLTKTEITSSYTTSVVV